MGIKHPLIRLVDDVNLLGCYWNKKHGLFKGACPVEDLIDAATIQRTLDAGLLRWPYFTILKDGNQPELSAFTKSRPVAGQSVKGFADPDKIREHLAAGATIKLNQLKDWHRPTRDLMCEIELLWPAELKSFVFYTPCDSTGMLPHRDGSHVLAVQIEGTKEWRIYDAPEYVDARPGLLDLNADSHSHAFVLDPGDVLYLPHGYPHVATARDGTSLHLTFTITEPGPSDLVRSLLATCADDLDRASERGRSQSLDENAQVVVKTLVRHVESIDPQILVDTAVLQMRHRRT